MINVSKPYLPPIDEYHKYLQMIWGSGRLTNQGPLVLELEKRLQDYLKLEFVHFVSNCTMALQIALNSLEIDGEVITSSFSFVATANALLWTNCQPVFVDIQKETLCIDPSKIEAAITGKTRAILATHVYGNPCDIKKIDEIAKANDLKVIYDGAHAFGVKTNNQSIFNFGDISVVSFHATKLYHTIEGGAIITNDRALAQRCRIISNFGLSENEPNLVGINGKNSEFHAAMGLCNLHMVHDIIKKQNLLSDLYKKELLSSGLVYPEQDSNVEYNYAYFPVIFPSEEIALMVMATLREREIHARRYFYPSLNNLPYYNNSICLHADDISKRVMCLPLYYELSFDDVRMISAIILKATKA